MVGRTALNRKIGVRFPVPQQHTRLSLLYAGILLCYYGRESNQPRPVLESPRKPEGVRDGGRGAAKVFEVE